MKRVFLSLAVLTFLLSCKKEFVPQENNAQVQAVSVNPNRPTIYHDGYKVPVDQIGFDDCTQEDIHITGWVDYNISETIVGTKVRYTFLTHYEHCYAIGLTTGNRYNVVGVLVDAVKGTIATEQDFEGNPLYVITPTTETIVNKLRIGSLEANGFYHLTTDANGNVRVEKADFLLYTCK